jgi:hypothetical protein
MEIRIKKEEEERLHDKFFQLVCGLDESSPEFKENKMFVIDLRNSIVAEK